MPMLHNSRILNNEIPKREMMELDNFEQFLDAITNTKNITLTANIVRKMAEIKSDEALEACIQLAMYARTIEAKHALNSTLEKYSEVEVMEIFKEISTLNMCLDEAIDKAINLDESIFKLFKERLQNDNN